MAKKNNTICKNSTMTADKAIQLIEKYHNESERDSHGRYKSWRHCYNEFSKNRNFVDEKTLDYLSLHLAFYLASWGMYRGSTFLLQKDYKVHIPVVKIIQEEQYNPLYAISAENLKQKSYRCLLFKISNEIKDCYKREIVTVEGHAKNATDTLITKILLGTLGCVPAYDSYYTQAVKKYDISSKQFNPKSVFGIADFYSKHSDKFEELRRKFCVDGTEYPPMKLMDMCFWQDTFESLKNNSKTEDNF